MGIHAGWYGDLVSVRATSCRRPPSAPQRRRLADPVAVAAARDRDALQARRLASVSLMSRALHRRRCALAAAAAERGLLENGAPPGGTGTGGDGLRNMLREARAACSEPAARLARLALEGEEAVEDDALRSIENYAPATHAASSATPLSPRVRGSPFERVPLDAAFCDCERVDTLDMRRLHSFRRGAHSGEAIEALLRRCRPNDADRDHWSGEDAPVLRSIAKGGSLLTVVRDTRATSPVTLFTPPDCAPLTAILSRAVEAGQPIAHYAGELISEEDEVRRPAQRPPRAPPNQSSH